MSITADRYSSQTSTSTTSPEITQSATSPGESSQLNIKQEPNTFNESQRPSSFDSSATSQQSSFLSNDFDQSRMVWKGHPSLCTSHHRQRSAANVQSTPVNPGPWADGMAGNQAGPASPLSASSDVQMFGFNPYVAPTAQPQAHPMPGQGHYGGYYEFGKRPPGAPS